MSQYPDWQLTVTVGLGLSCHEPGALRYPLPLSSATFEGRWPMFLCERTWLQHQAAHLSLSLLCLLGPLRWQRHSSWGWGLPPAGCLAACLPLFLRARWTLIPQQRHRVPGKGKQIHLVASNNHSAPVGTGRGKLIVCLQRLDIVNVFAIDGVR